MRLTHAPAFQQFGNVNISAAQRVVELEAGSCATNDATIAVSGEALSIIQSQMAIVVACMNEDNATINGVLSGIPNSCLIILVSNSRRGPVDKYEEEVALLADFCTGTGRTAIAVHQRDQGVAAAFVSGGMSGFVDREGLVPNGKGEAMIIGVALAAMADKKYVGFIDADNFISGSVNEYCKVYAAGFYQASSPLSMVRICWGSKPKVRDNQLVFDRKGRSSQLVNKWLNRVLRKDPDSSDDLIVTGNAGEHAMTIDLARQLRLASGFAIEPYELIDILESHDDRDFNASNVPIEIQQIQTLNPHLHANKGDGHVENMQLQALGALYHSSITPQRIKKSLVDTLVKSGVLKSDQVPATARVYPPLKSLNLSSVYDMLNKHAASFRRFNWPPC